MTPYPLSPVLMPSTLDSHRAWCCLVSPTPKEQRSGDPYEGAALTLVGVFCERMKREILAELGPDWSCLGVEIGGRS